ncbi:hypothetical protein H5410_039135 [Solanum commersonii]|uniref:Uncharacterized protein n=1 Tax=Solanum commersonii TaxID=4109 RepID=A0A9J5YDF5_SOLCO|nr:hypothetical protein H5410_039135 [Solanum commersonii]
MGGYNQFLYYYTISRVSRIKLLARPGQPFFLDTIRRYSKENYDHHAEEKAPTTAEEFTRVAEEMAEEKEHQSFSSQTVDKAQDAIKEATTTTDSTFDLNLSKKVTKRLLEKKIFIRSVMTLMIYLKVTHKAKLVVKI